MKATTILFISLHRKTVKWEATKCFMEWENWGSSWRRITSCLKCMGSILNFYKVFHWKIYFSVEQKSNLQTMVNPKNTSPQLILCCLIAFSTWFVQKKMLEPLNTTLTQLGEVLTLKGTTNKIAPSAAEHWFWPLMSYIITTRTMFTHCTFFLLILFPIQNQQS